MSYHSHKVVSVSDSHIIGRTDPITGDSIKEKDKVVFCLSCHSCFLEESWNYMNNTHCQQQLTLKFIPLPPPQLIVKKKEEKLIAELRDSGINILSILLLGILFGCLTYLLAGYDKFNFIVLSVVGGILIGTLLQTKIIKKFLGIAGNEIRIYKNCIEIENTKFYWNEIEKIYFKRTMFVEFDDRHGTQKVSSYSPSLGIRLKNGEYIDTKLPTENYPKIKLFLFGLAWVSQFTNIYFYTEHEKEYGLIKSFDRNYQGNIEIGVPNQLVYNPEES